MLLQQGRPAGVTITRDSDENAVVLTYDPSGKLKRVTADSGAWFEFRWEERRIASIVDSIGREADYSYDARNRLVSVATPPATLDASAPNLERR